MGCMERLADERGASEDGDGGRPVWRTEGMYIREDVGQCMLSNLSSKSPVKTSLAESTQ